MPSTSADPTTSRTKRWKPRWWQMALVAIGVVLLSTFLVLLLMRANGRARWFAYVAAEQAAGRSLSLDYFATHAPPVDHEIQTAWDDAGMYASSVLTGRTADPLEPHRLAFAAWVAGHGPFPTAVSECLTNQGKDLATFLATIRSGRLVLSNFGWAAESLAARRSGRTFPQHYLNQKAITLLAEWLHHHAVLCDDPTQDLSDLDALHAALARPEITIDAMIAIAVARIRDRTHLDLAIRDRLLAPVRERWLAEPCHSLALFGAGLQGDRVMSAEMYTEWLDVGLFRFMNTHGGSWRWQWRQLGEYAAMPWLWATMWDDLPQMHTYLDRAATSLRGGSSDPFPDFLAFRNSLSLLGRFSTAPKMEYLLTYPRQAAEQEANHREMQLATRILALRQHGRLPVDQAELLARLGDAQALIGGRNRYTLRYERPAPDRFRLVIDPASPVPDFDEPRLMSARTKAASSPPSASPLTTEPFIEIQLPPTP